MRLLGDPTKQAAVEIYDGFTWRSICATYWNLRAADLVCRHFGYEFVLGALKIPVEAELSQPKMMQFHCPLSSAVYESLLQCNAKTNAICLCSKQRAGVICSKGESLPPPLVTIRGSQVHNCQKMIEKCRFLTYLCLHAAYIACRCYKPCEFPGFVWTD